MSTLQNMNQKEVTGYAKKLYKSFGVKSVIALQEEEWLNVFTIIQFTRRNVEDLNKQHSFLEEKLGKLDYPNFKVILQAKPIDQFPSIITELKSGFLKIGDLNTKLLAKNPQTIENQNVGHYGNIVHPGEYAEFDHYAVTENMERSPAAILYELSITAESLGLRHYADLACSWLGINSLQNPTNILIAYPIYATINQIRYQGGNEVKISLKIDENLVENSVIWLNRSPSEHNAPIIERRPYKLEACQKTVEGCFYYITRALIDYSV